MLGLLEFLQFSFYESSRWNQDNFYSSLAATAQALLDFKTPCGFRFHLSSLPSPNFASSYTLGTTGNVDGSISYLYSSLPLQRRTASANVALEEVTRGYRQLKELLPPDNPSWSEVWHSGKRVDKKNVLLYGRMFLPSPTLEALYVRRLSPTQQVKVSCVSDANLPNGGNILTILQRDVGKYSTEYLYSTDSALLGARGLYNFGPDPRFMERTPTEPLFGRFSAGAELYYGVLNKSGGISAGLRFATLPQHTGFPYTMTLTVNPLMGNLSSTYAVKAGRNLALCSRFDFNFYSYESGLKVGCELWRRRQKEINDDGGNNDSNNRVNWAKKMIRDDGRKPDSEGEKSIGHYGEDHNRDNRNHDYDDNEEETVGLLKVSADENWNVGVLWESRLKHLLCTLGASFDLRKRDQIFRAVGLELQYSS